MLSDGLHRFILHGHLTLFIFGYLLVAFFLFFRVLVLFFLQFSGYVRYFLDVCQRLEILSYFTYVLVFWLGTRKDVHQEYALFFGLLEGFDGAHKADYGLFHIYQEYSIVWGDCHRSLICWVEMYLHEAVLTQKVVLVALDPAPVVTRYLQTDHRAHASLGRLVSFSSFRRINTRQYILLDFLAHLG